MVYILKYGELWLKGKNRPVFEKRLKKNIRKCLEKNNKSLEDIKLKRDKVIIRSKEDCSRLSYVFGISFLCKVEEVKLDLEEIKKASLKHYKKGTFRIRCKRTKKDFGMNSQEVEREVGKYIAEKKKAKVDLKNYESEIFIEIDDKAYVYNEKIKCKGGLPVGTAGTVTVVIDSRDSVIAAILMMKKGCKVEVIKEKDINIGLLDKFSCGFKIKEVKAPSKYSEALIKVEDIKRLKKGEYNLTVLNPLIGMSKEKIEELIR